MPIFREAIILLFSGNLQFAKDIMVIATLRILLIIVGSNFSVSSEKHIHVINTVSAEIDGLWLSCSEVLVRTAS